MRGLLYPLLGLLAVAVILTLGYLTARAIRELRRRSAKRCARWETHLSPGGDGTVSVAVRRVARWGNQEEVLGVEEIARVRVDDPTSPDLLDAQAQAELRAVSYNAWAGAP